MMYTVTWSNGIKGWYYSLDEAIYAASSRGLESTVHQQSKLIATYTFFRGINMFENSYI
jgi:hypothetical protein